MKMCKEMRKLRKWLTKNKIPWIDHSDNSEHYYMCRTKFGVNGNDFSVINGRGSYGGYHSLYEKNQGLLECWVNHKGEPEGYLTADDVIQKIKNLLAS